MKLLAALPIVFFLLVFPAIAEEPLPSPSVQEKLIGRWIRTDGGYMIDVKKIKPNGSVVAEYSNPKRIHVSEANVSVWKEFDQLFIKLEDKGYPGSTYKLYYFAEKDQLAGFYYQAVTKETFEVLFIRKK